MPIFKIVNSSKLTRINETNFPLEKHLQGLVEKNLQTVFDLEFVTSEFQLKDLRVDTLAYNPESNSFVIIEYKRDKNISVIDQGYAYLSLLLNNKADFTLVYNDNKNVYKKMKDIDWTQSKVIFVSPLFSPYQRKAIEFQDLPIELWEVKLYDNDTILFNQIQPAEKRESIKKISQGSEVIKSVSSEIRVYTEEDTLRKYGQKTKELYYRFKDFLFEIGTDITISPKKKYIALKRNTANFAKVIPRQYGLRLSINTSKFKINDPKGIVIYRSQSAKINLKNESEIPYVIGLVRQSYEKNQ